MNTQNIYDCLLSDDFTKDLIKKVCSRDEFLDSINRTGGYGLYVFNTHYSDQPGEHWLAAFYTKKNIEVFDSFGRSLKSLVPDVWKKFDSLFKRKDIYWNKQRVQGITTNTCGDYCVLFSLLLARGWQMKDIVDVLLQIKDNEIRDHAVRRFTLNTFGKESVEEVLNPSGQAKGVDQVHTHVTLF